MFFQKKVDRAFKHLHEKSDYADKELYSVPDETDRENIPELEKNDFLAMVLAAFLTIIPLALIVMGALGLLFFFFMV